jgi:hypothetical protein
MTQTVFSALSSFAAAFHSSVSYVLSHLRAVLPDNPHSLEKFFPLTQAVLNSNDLYGFHQAPTNVTSDLLVDEDVAYPFSIS